MPAGGAGMVGAALSPSLSTVVVSAAEAGIAMAARAQANIRLVVRIISYLSFGRLFDGWKRDFGRGHGVGAGTHRNVHLSSRNHEGENRRDGKNGGRDHGPGGDRTTVVAALSGSVSQAAERDAGAVEVEVAHGKDQLARLAAKACVRGMDDLTDARRSGRRQHLPVDDERFG